MRSDKVNGYIDYFRTLAVTHKDILHDISSESGTSGTPGSKKFTKVSVEEVIEGLKTSIGFPALLLELYESNSTSAIVYDIRLKPRGAFMVLDHPQDDSFAAEQACYSTCERIIYELLQQIWQHHYKRGVDRCNTPFKEFNFATLQIIPVGPLFNGEYGYRCEFDFEFHNTVNIAQPPADGTFIELS